MWEKREAYYLAPEQRYNVSYDTVVIGDGETWVERRKEDGSNDDLTKMLDDIPSDDEEEVAWEDVVFEGKE